MSKAHDDARHRSDMFIERVLTLTAEMKRTAEELTDALGLPSDYVYDVLAGIPWVLLKNSGQEPSIDEGIEETACIKEEEVSQ